MHLTNPSNHVVRNELDLIAEHLPLNGIEGLELGCGRAAMTRAIAQGFAIKSLVATEIDQAQHAKNLLIKDLPQVAFRYGGAEAIDAEDASFDRVFMFKSLHHVPEASMGPAIEEIARVLRRDGLAWISEPVYAGEYNELMSLFHDEKQVREAAFNAIRQAIADGLFQLERQIFFSAARHFPDFAAFEDQIINVTHLDLSLDPGVLSQIRERFEARLTSDGACFESQMRVDLLRRC